MVNTYGARLNLKNGALSIHSDEEEQLISFDEIQSISLCNAISVSTDVLIAAIEKNIEVVLNDRSGNHLGRFWTGKYGSISLIRKKQLEYSMTNEAKKLAVGLVAEKIENQTALLQLLYDQYSDLKRIVADIEKLTRQKEKIREAINQDSPITDNQIRGYEGTAGSVYFSALSNVLPEKYRFIGRTFRPARDMFNAMLNYAYGMLYGKIEHAMLNAGVDPSIGFFHRDDYGKPVFVFDVIERYRTWADYVAANLCLQEVMFADFFEVQEGSWYMNTVGKRIIIQGMNDYMDEVVELNGTDRSRERHIFLYVQQLAQLFKNYKPK